MAKFEVGHKIHCFEAFSHRFWSAPIRYIINIRGSDMKFLFLDISHETAHKNTFIQLGLNPFYVGVFLPEAHARTIHNPVPLYGMQNKPLDDTIQPIPKLASRMFQEAIKTRIMLSASLSFTTIKTNYINFIKQSIKDYAYKCESLSEKLEIQLMKTESLHKGNKEDAIEIVKFEFTHSLEQISKLEEALTYIESFSDAST